MTSLAAEQAVREVLSEIALGTDCLDAPRDMTLDAIGIDSAAMIELVFVLEDRLSIRIAEDEIGPDNFESIATLTAMVTRKCP